MGGEYEMNDCESNAPAIMQTVKTPKGSPYFTTWFNLCPSLCYIFIFLILNSESIPLGEHFGVTLSTTAIG